MESALGTSALLLWWEQRSETVYSPACKTSSSALPRALLKLKYLFGALKAKSKHLSYPSLKQSPQQIIGLTLLFIENSFPH